MKQLISAVSGHPLIAQNVIARQFIKFGIVGFVNTIIDFSTYVLLTRGFDYFEEHKFLANTIAFMLAVTNSFFWNKYWTFREKSSSFSVQYPKFFLVSFGGLGITQGIFVMLHGLLAISDLVAKIAAIILVMVWNFLANKYWTFRIHSPQ